MTLSPTQDPCTRASRTALTAFAFLAFGAFLLTVPTGCGDVPKVVIDGSSTVQPISEAVGEEFTKKNPSIQVSVGTSGTGGGFKKFVKGEIDINDASRPIKEEEAASAATAGIEFIELPVAFDGISIIVNPKNDFVDHLTVAELKKIWEPGSTVTKWSDIRPNWPDKELKLYGPGADSGTFDYFTEAINGKSGACRKDFTASENDNTLVTGVSGDENAMGYFGFAYYEENKDKLKIVPVVDNGAPVAPSQETINNGSYTPLSRPIFIYVSAESAKQEHVKQFVRFYLENAPTLVPDVGYVPLPDAVYKLALERFEAGKTGSIFLEEKTQHLSLEDALKVQ